MTLKLCQININGLSDITKLALNRYMCQQELDVVCLSETKTETLPTGTFSRMNHILKPNKDNHKQRGVAIVAKSNIQLTRYPELEPPTADMLVCIAKLGGHRYFICSAYSPPSDGAKLREITEALKNISDQAINMRVTGIMLLGDLNARHQAWGDHSHNKAGETLLEFSRETGLEIVYQHDEPSFLCDNGSSHIDLLICSNNIAQRVQNQHTDISIELFTGAPHRGHVPVITELVAQQPHIAPKTYYKWNNADWYGFRDSLESCCQQNLHKITSTTDPTKVWNIIKNILQRCKSKHVPTGTTNLHNKPYWNKELSVLSVNLREAKAQFKYRSSYDNGDKLDEARNKFKDAISRAQQTYIENKAKTLNEHSNDKFWINFKNVFFHQENSSIGDLVDENGAVLHEDRDKAHHLFERIYGGNENYQPPTGPMSNHRSKIDNTYIEELSAPITMDEIRKALTKLKAAGKSADFDGIHPKMLKQSTNFFLIALYSLFNKVLESHQWPWGSSNLVIFLKKPGKNCYTDTGSYRPITISSHVGKTLERIMEARLRALVEHWSILPTTQFGFREGRGTLMYLLKLLTELTHHVKAKRHTAALFLDLQKAFDTVWHQGMIYRLEELGIKGNFLQLINSFLTTREISLKVNSYTHPAQKCTVGLPQGSVLSPLLFIIYIRDMLEHTSGTGLQYADDCTVLFTANSSEDLQDICKSNCDNIQKWMDKWRLKVNYQKTEVIPFHGQLVPPTMKSVPIRISESTKVLGLTVDHKLSFTQQYASCMKALEQKSNMLKPFVFAGLNCETAKKIFTQAIIPKAMYAASLWDTTSKVNITQYIKFFLGAHYNPPSEALHKLIDIPPPTLLYTCERLHLMRGLAKYGYTDIISSSPKSGITKVFLSDFKKVFDRHTQLQDIQPTALSKPIIKKTIQKEWSRMWSTQLSQGACPYGLLSQLPPTYLDDHPIPLDFDRRSIGTLCDLLTGHSRLQLFQFRVNLSYTPICSCLRDEETPQHYLFHCPEYTGMRRIANPSLHDWTAVIQFNMLTKRLSF